MSGMQIEDLEKKFIKYATQKHILELKELVFECSEEELENVIKKTLPNSAFPKLWDSLLKAFQDTSNCHQKRIKVVLTTLGELDNQHSVSSDLCSKLIQRLCMDLVKLRTEHLVDICNFCLNSIQSKQNVKNCCSWKDLLPDTIRILSEKDMVVFDELDYSGQEFKSTFITTLCVMNWCPEKTTQLAAMFSDMSLTKDEHLKVVIKLTSYMEKLVPQEIPSYVYQLLTLCRHQNGRIIFAKLQHYFGLRIYNSSNFWKDNNSESSPDLDLIENAEDHEALDAESMVLFHIQSAAGLGHSCIKDHITSLKNAEKSPDFILHPFQLLVLFAISTAAQYEDPAFDIIRHAIVRFYVEQSKRSSSCWYREIISVSSEPEKLFTQIMDLQKRDFLLEAFSNFGFNLLSVGSALGRDIIAEKQWTLGSVIMLKLIKRKTCITPVLLRTFCNHILTRSSSTQYIDCLYYLSKTSPLLMLENQSCIVEMIENLMQITNQVAIQLVDALMPLTKVSSAIRDQFILIFRKCLYSRSVDTRLVAVYGYVKLISTLNISGKGSLSQNSMGSFSSGYSIYTQISLNRSSQVVGFGHLGNEAICWEVLGILKRTFMQQVVIKMELYDDLYNAVCVNQELATPVLDMLWLHLMEFIVLNEEGQPLNFTKVVNLSDTECIPKEALGHLLFIVSQLVVKIDQLEDESDNTVKKHLHILDSLCEKMANCELEHLNLNDGTDLTDSLPESQQKLHILKEVIHVIEALIGFKIANLKAGQENQCRIIDSLFQGYTRFYNFGKIIFKPKKGKKGDKATQKEDTSAENSTLNGSKKSNSGAKCASKILGLSETLLNFAIVSKGLKTLLESNVPWVSANDATVLRTRIDVHRHFLRSALVLIGKYKNYKAIDTVYKKIDYDHITSIAETIYNRIICRLNDYMDFDCISAIIGIECFNSILLLINLHFKSNLISFLSKVGGKDKSDSLVSHLKPLLKVFEGLFEKDEDELTAADPEVKKYHPAILSNISTLCSFIPPDNNVLSIEVYEWVKQIAYNNSIPVKVSSGFMSLMCDLHVRFKSGLILLEHASNSFSDVYGSIRDDDSVIENEETLKIVNPGTANFIILSICSSIKTVLDDTENVISRLKSDWYILNYPGEHNNNTNKEELKAKEKGVSCQLCFVSRILTNLLKISLPSGTTSDGVFKNVVQLYSCLSSLTKYLISRSTQTAIHEVWFEKLIKIVGKRLAPAVYDFVYHMEAGQKENEQTQGAKSKSEGSSLKNKILRETKAIPKVIYEIEQFGRYLMQLSKKTKFDFSKYLGQGTSRDFRIDLKVFQQDLKRAGAEGSTQSDDDDANSSVNEALTNVNQADGDSSISNDESVEIPSPSKKRRK